MTARRVRRRAWAGLSVPLLVVLTAAPAAEKSPRGDVRRSFEESKEAFRREIARILDEGAEALANRLADSFERRLGELEARVSRLEAELRRRDARIAELEETIQKLGGEVPGPKKPAAKKPAVKKPEPEKPGARGFLGVVHAPVPPPDRERLGLRGGALVERVLPGSPASRAGLEAGDIIVSIGGKEVSSDSLSEALSAHRAGEEIEIVYLRDGRKVSARVRLGDRAAFFAPGEKPAARAPVVLGVEIVEVEEGISVERVEPGFTGSAAGLKPGDRLLEVAGRKVRTFEDVAAALGTLREGDEFAIAFVRGPHRFDVRVVGARGDRGAKLISKRLSAARGEEQPRIEEKPAAREGSPSPKSPAALGVEVVLGDEPGAEVASVLPGSAAEEAGIRPGDVIRKVGEKEVTGANLRRVLAEYSAGDKARLSISRGGETLEVEVEFRAPQRVEPGKRAPAPEGAEKPREAREVVGREKPAKPSPEKPRPPGRLGVTAVESGEAVSLKTVFEGSPAARAGLREGDRILQAKGKDVRTLDDLAEALQGLSRGDRVALKIQRGEEVRDVEVELGGPPE